MADTPPKVEIITFIRRRRRRSAADKVARMDPGGDQDEAVPEPTEPPIL